MPAAKVEVPVLPTVIDEEALILSKTCRLRAVVEP